jgi:hypothetical protein
VMFSSESGPGSQGGKGRGAGAAWWGTLATGRGGTPRSAVWPPVAARACLFPRPGARRRIVCCAGSGDGQRLAARSSCGAAIDRLGRRSRRAAHPAAPWWVPLHARQSATASLAREEGRGEPGGTLLCCFTCMARGRRVRRRRISAWSPEKLGRPQPAGFGILGRSAGWPRRWRVVQDGAKRGRPQRGSFSRRRRRIGARRRLRPAREPAGRPARRSGEGAAAGGVNGGVCVGGGGVGMLGRCDHVNMAGGTLPRRPASETCLSFPAALMGAVGGQSAAHVPTKIAAFIPLFDRFDQDPAGVGAGGGSQAQSIHPRAAACCAARALGGAGPPVHAQRFPSLLPCDVGRGPPSAWLAHCRRGGGLSCFVGSASALLAHTEARCRCFGERAASGRERGRVRGLLGRSGGAGGRGAARAAWCRSRPVLLRGRGPGGSSYVVV